MKVIKNIDIYLTNKRPVRTIDVVQYDTGIQLVFTVKDFTIPSGSSATLFVQKPSGKFVYQDFNITISGNTITIDLENQALTEYGYIPYQVSIENGTDTATTFKGIMIVEEKLGDSGAIKSGTVVRAFDELTVEKLAEFQTRAETIANGVIATIPEDYSEMTAKVNESANAIKGHLSGAVVRADDVSPVEHYPVVKVICPEDVDPSTVTVTRCGKNILPYPFYNKTKAENGITFTDNGDGTITANGTATDDAFFHFIVNRSIRVKGNYVLSGLSGGSGLTYYIQPFISGKAVSGLTQGSKSYEFDGFLEKITMVVSKGTTLDNLKVKLQLEQGNTTTDFEAYNGTEYTPNADGIVPGVTSVSPTMTILTDTEGVTIECEYNKDTNKVISKLVNAISAMGGEVTI